MEHTWDREASWTVLAPNMRDSCERGIDLSERKRRRGLDSSTRKREVLSSIPIRRTHAVISIDNVSVNANDNASQTSGPFPSALWMEMVRSLTRIPIVVVLVDKGLCGFSCLSMTQRTQGGIGHEVASGCLLFRPRRIRIIESITMANQINDRNVIHDSRR